MNSSMRTPDTECGLDAALAVIGGKWKPIVLYHLRIEPRRFGDLKRLVTGISEKVLIQQLRELVAAGVLTRHDYQEVPPKVDYSITAFGQTLVHALPQPADRPYERVEASRSRRSHAKHRRASPFIEIRASRRDPIAILLRP